MRCVVQLLPGSAAIPGKPLPQHDRAVMALHLDAMRGLYARGALLFGGPFTHGMAGLAVLEADDEREAAAMMDADPAIAAGIIAYRIEPIRPMFDAFPGGAGAAR